MNIHLFGHSICRSSKGTVHPTETFVDILEKKYSNENDTITIHQADSISEERILYFVKKIKNPDVLIIFHQVGDSIFIPSHQHDSAVSKIKNKFTVSHKFEGTFNYHKHVIDDKSKINLETRDSTNLQQSIDSHFEYLYTRDLNNNRYFGALVQLDQYLVSKQIPVIHCTYGKNLPAWFKFSTGIIDINLTILQDKGEFTCSHNESANRINSEGNIFIANTLIKYINDVTNPNLISKFKSWCRRLGSN